MIKVCPLYNISYFFGTINNGSFETQTMHERIFHTKVREKLTILIFFHCFNKRNKFKCVTGQIAAHDVKMFDKSLKVVLFLVKPRKSVSCP